MKMKTKRFSAKLHRRHHLDTMTPHKVIAVINTGAMNVAKHNDYNEKCNNIVLHTRLGVTECILLKTILTKASITASMTVAIAIKTRQKMRDLEH